VLEGVSPSDPLPNQGARTEAGTRAVESPGLCWGRLLKPDSPIPTSSAKPRRRRRSSTAETSAWLGAETREIQPPQGGADAGPNVDELIGSRIRERRRALRLTQEDLATRVGVTPQQVHKYESGANRIAASMLFEIAAVLQAPISTFFEGAIAGGEARAKEHEQFAKEMRELALGFEDIGEARLRRLILRIIKAATEADKDGD
jgi:transcriptional regulator with XRE-family HTH domain